MNMGPVGNRPRTTSATPSAAPGVGQAAPAAGAASSQAPAGPQAPASDSFASASRAASSAGLAGQVPSALRRSSSGRSSGPAEAASLAAPTSAGPAQSVDATKVFASDGKASAYALHNFSQIDDPNNTMGGDSGEARCAANSAVASLALRGKDAMVAGIQGVKADLQGEIKELSKSKDPADQQRIGVLKHRLKEVESLEKSAKSGNMDIAGMKKFADLAYTHYDIPRDGKQMHYEDQMRMQKAMGLLPADTPLPPKMDPMDPRPSPLDDKFKVPNPPDSKHGANVTLERRDGKITVIPNNYLQEQQGKAADAAWSKLGPGETATVGVYNGPPPPGKPNHMVTIGKDAEGKPYMYDPMNKPHVKFEGDAQGWLKEHVGLDLRNGKTANTETGVQELYEGYPSLPFFKQQGSGGFHVRQGTTTTEVYDGKDWKKV